MFSVFVFVLAAAFMQSKVAPHLMMSTGVGADPGFLAASSQPELT